MVWNVPELVLVLTSFEQARLIVNISLSLCKATGLRLNMGRRVIFHDPIVFFFTLLFLIDEQLSPYERATQASGPRTLFTRPTASSSFTNHYTTKTHGNVSRPSAPYNVYLNCDSILSKNPYACGDAFSGRIPLTRWLRGTINRAETRASNHKRISVRIEHSWGTNALWSLHASILVVSELR
jgi:hypothetical protein